MIGDEKKRVEKTWNIFIVNIIEKIQIIHELIFPFQKKINKDYDDDDACLVWQLFVVCIHWWNISIWWINTWNQH